jgi:hypothetical protein
MTPNLLAVVLLGAGVESKVEDPRGVVNGPAAPGHGARARGRTTRACAAHLDPAPQPP